MSAVTCRTATLSEVALMLDWAAEEGWNPGLSDAAAFHAADPKGFFVAEVGGTPVAAISVVNHSAEIAFLGLYICRPDFRGEGVGFALWQHGLAHAGTRVVGLDGVPAQEGNYRKSGFGRAGRTLRFAGRLPHRDRTLPVAGADALPAIRQLDRRANGFDRLAFLEAWTADRPDRKTVLLDGGTGLTGFATARLCRAGCKIGPIVAPTDAEALSLAHQAAAALGQTEVIIDAPDSQTGFVTALTELSFEVTFSTARMYRGTPPKADESLKAIATMELG